MAIEYGARWRLVSESDFDEFLRRYPRPLTIEPPLDQLARVRRYADPTLGTWPQSQVATVHRTQRRPSMSSASTRLCAVAAQ